MLNKEIILNNELETTSLARDFAKHLKIGDIVVFKGNLGSGKTFFCRQIIQTLCGNDIVVTSPTYNLLQTYPNNDNSCEIYHYDLYRLKHPDEVIELAIEEAFSANITLIEWPEIIENTLPKNHIEITLEIIDDTRRKCIVKHTSFETGIGVSI
ncbi:MAG: tRNA (adenosine(37)-N6)-threonylcarbamoyltransferase complex ATPase subunit type 1 TsaE [Rickettsiaceae bacterium]|nr:tRNA (adenosine(37)-N6)-threonylcarbamoyltransferase complex ATPase subunit type 1 TsaE [Rickettsiaceae bacterium]